MLNWKSQTLGFLCLVFLPLRAWADPPAEVPIQAEVEHDPASGKTIRILSEGYPPRKPGDWFAIRSGNEAGIFAIDQATGSISLENPQRLESEQPSKWTLIVEAGDPPADQPSSKRQFLLATGLTKREADKQLGLFTTYKIEIRRVSRNLAPTFPPRPEQFYWPSEGDEIGRVRARDPDSEGKIVYSIKSQNPPGIVKIDPETGVLRLTNQESFADAGDVRWSGIVTARDASGLSASTKVWITPPLAFPNLAWADRLASWSRNQIPALRRQTGKGWEQFTGVLTSRIRQANPFDHSLSSAKLNGKPETSPKPQPTKTGKTRPSVPADDGDSQTASTANSPSPEEPEFAFLPEPAVNKTWIFNLLKVWAIFLVYLLLRINKSGQKDGENSEPGHESEADETKAPANDDAQQFVDDSTDSLRDVGELERELEREWNLDFPEEPDPKNGPDNEPVVEKEPETDAELTQENNEESDHDSDRLFADPSLQSPCDFEGNAEPDFRQAGGTETPGGIESDAGSGSTEFPEDFGSGPSPSSDAPQEKHPPYVPAARESEAAALTNSQRQALAMMNSDSKPPRTDPAGPNEAELSTLLGLLDDKYGILRDASGDPVQQETQPTESAADPERIPEAKPATEPERKPEPPTATKTDLDMSVSDYMNRLLANYSSDNPISGKTGGEKKSEPAKKSARATTEPTASGSPSDQVVSEPPPVRIEPVHSLDRESTRSQIELLRHASNETVAFAIRKASSRRNRRRALKIMLFCLLATATYVAWLFLPL